jgi:chromosome segregation ATPase
VLSSNNADAVAPPPNYFSFSELVPVRSTIVKDRQTEEFEKQLQSNSRLVKCLAQEIDVHNAQLAEKDKEIAAWKDKYEELTVEHRAMADAKNLWRDKYTALVEQGLAKSKP